MRRAACVLTVIASFAAGGGSPFSIVRGGTSIHRELYLDYSSKRPSSARFALTSDRWEWESQVYEQRRQTPTLFGRLHEWQMGKRGGILKYEPALIGPSDEEDFHAGLGFTMAHRLRWERAVGHSVFFVRQRIYIHSFSQPGAFFNGTFYANPVLEGRTTVGMDVPVGERVKLSLPLHWQERRYSDAVGAKYGGRWRHWLWISPQVSFVLGPGSELIASYTSESLICSKTGQWMVVEGLQSGLFELTLKVTL